MRLVLPLLLAALACACAGPSRTHETPMTHRQSKLAPCLWFQGNAEEALRFYASVFDGAVVTREIRAGDGGPMPKGMFIAGRIAVQGFELMVLEGNPQPGFTHSISLSVACRDQAELDRYWSALTKGGKEIECGWLEDKYGVAWQIVPERLEAMLADPDPAKAQRTMAAMLTMKKLDVAALERAYAGK